MQQIKIIFYYLKKNFLVRPCLAKTIFSSLENYQNRSKSVFVKHLLRPKILL